MATSSSGLPTPQSYENILSDMLSAYASKQGINDLNVGSALTSFFEVVSLAVARSSGDVFQILRDYSIDRATGEALKRLATENNIKPITSKLSTGLVTITDSSFTKISTKVYSGANPPNTGSIYIKVSDASLFPGSGQIYIGRGTTNVEGPIPYYAIVPTGGYYTLNLSVATTKFHNIGESVILAQGGSRSIPANAVVSAPSSGGTADIQYSIVTAAVILDGETVVDNVQVAATTTGAASNVPRGAIKKFSSPPFAGATVTNNLAFTTGKDSETDDELRIRIKSSNASKGLGTPNAIKSAVQNATASDEPQSSIVSSSILAIANGSILYIDDGNGYEAKTAGVSLESIIDSALGGEKYFQLTTGGRQAPVAKAFLKSTIAAPFDLIGTDTLAIIVGGIVYQHVFVDADFRSPGGATAYEIITSINANTTLEFEATTSEGGQYVVLRSKNEGNDSIQITTPTTSGRDAAALIGFPSSESQTLRLYKNKIPLSKDGNTASVFSHDQYLWSTAISNNDTLIISVDGTAPITYTIINDDFIATGLYVTVSSLNSLDSWAQVFNSKLTGVTASVVGQKIELSSNLGSNDRASIAIDYTSTLVSKGMFSLSAGLSMSGKQSDYILDRNTAQFTLNTPLVAGDQLSAGSTQTEARIQSLAIPAGSLTFTSDAHMWLLSDIQGQIITTGVTGTTTITVSKPSTNVVRYTSNILLAFQNVKLGDYVIIWSEELNVGNRLEGRVHAFTNSTMDLLVSASEYASAIAEVGIVYSSGLTVIRTALAPQKFRVLAGINKTLNQIAIELQSQTNNLTFTVQQDQYLVIRSKTKDTSGYVMVVTVDIQGKILSFPVATSDFSKDSLISSYNNQNAESSLPLFIHSTFAADSVANPIDSFATSLTSSISLSGRDPNEMISIIHPYGSSYDAQPYGESVQEKTISGSVATIGNQNLLRRIRTVDRFYLANPFDFGSQDTSVVIIDNDTNSKAFEVPYYRRAITNVSNVNNALTFNAYDVDSDVTANFSSAFGSFFDFSNFKVLMRAKKVLKPTPTKTALLFRATKWGRSGEKINVGYSYPSSASLGIDSVITVDQSVNIKIALKSGAAIATSIDSSTSWNVSITPNTPSAGIDQVTYSYNSGTLPALTGLSGGEYVNITNASEFNSRNIGVFRISTQAGFLPSATTFSVQRPTGAALAETNKATLTTSSISFYQSSATTAADINTYVNTELSNYFTSTIVLDGDVSGSGIIDLSTYEDSGFTYASKYLLDGINWIASSSLSSSPNFTFKVPLVLPSDVGYKFNESEEVRLIPTTIDQIRRFTSVLAVSGLTTVGTIGAVDRGSKIEIATNILGSSGSVQIIGGLANNYSVPVLDSATRMDNSLASVSVRSSSSSGIHSDQWFKLQASYAQRKDAFFSSNTGITVLSDNPVVNQSTINLVGRSFTQRYFGKPRHHIKLRGRTFRIEKQGSLACLSWNSSTSSTPNFLKTSLNFDDSLGGTVNVEKISSESKYTILSGNTNFNELSIGDLITVAGLPNSANNGTFPVTGVSDDGTVIQVSNQNAQNEFSFGNYTLTGDLSPGDTFTVVVNPGAVTTVLTAGTSFAIVTGDTTATAANLSAVLGTIYGITSTSSLNVATVTATFGSADITLSKIAPNATTTGALVGVPFVTGNFSASSAVSEGDTLVVGSPFAVLNQGQFRVIRRYNDSVWYENANIVEEEVLLPDSANVTMTFDATTSFKINAINNSIYMNWNGAGTEPSLGNIQMGDIVRFGLDFASANRGDYMALRSGKKLQQISQLTMPNATDASNAIGLYFDINDAGNVNRYRVWFYNGSNVAPASGGRSLVSVNISGLGTSTEVAVAASSVLGALTNLDTTQVNNIITVTTTDSVTIDNAPAPTQGTMPTSFFATLLQNSQIPYVECVNPSATNETAVFVTTGVFEVHRPQLLFSEYEAAVPGDLFVATGDILGLLNTGSHTIARVLSRDSVLINKTMIYTPTVGLSGRETAAYVQEGAPYTGYKHVVFATSQPGSPSRNLVIFDTNAQYQKIDEAAGVMINSLNKMNFSTIIKKGLDSYSYNTGLIAEANRIIYGDPRDSSTYSGVGAAGADTFVREPLARRIQMSINIRLQTGVPFAQTADQVRSSISSLVNSNSIGESIAISSIISVINAIPGLRAVSISSPQYDSSHDLIFLAPGEKARIIDPTTDISVSN